MDLASTQHHQQQQEMSSQTLESMLLCTKAQQEKKPRPPDQAALNCPRCDSTNTKFCYYNNYSLSQPRYFCKSCRRYWTKGGTLRNVPVGGGCRKNKRSSSSAHSSSSSSSSSLSKRINQDHQPLITSSNSNPLISSLTHLPYDSNTDLSLAFARLQSHHATGQLGFDHDLFCNANASTHATDHFLGNNPSHSFLDALRGGFLQTTPNGPFHNHVYYGSNIGNHAGEMGNVENGGLINVSEEMGINNPYHEEHIMSSGATTSVTVTTVKQESWNGREVREGENSKVLWGFPRQLVGGEGNMVEVDSGRQTNGWNGLGSTNWHGLLNSPLM